MGKLVLAGVAEDSPIAFTLLSFAGSAALGAASYYLVGRYFIALGRRLPRGRREARPAVTAA